MRLPSLIALSVSMTLASPLRTAAVENALPAEPTAKTEVATLPVILVTAYKAFAGRGVNGSETIATALEGQVIAGHRVSTLVMPVRWGEPESSMPRAIADRHPTMVLGLGEGYPGKVTVEFTAKNQAEHPDEDKKAPPAELLKGGPATRTARVAFDAAWFTGTKIPVVRSEDAGTYLCNDCLYVGLGTDVPTVGFMHLPPQGDASSDAYRALLVPIVTEMLKRNGDAKPDPKPPASSPGETKPKP